MWVPVALLTSIRGLQPLFFLILLTLSAPIPAENYSYTEYPAPTDAGDEAAYGTEAEPGDAPLSVSILMPRGPFAAAQTRMPRSASTPDLIADVARLYRIDPHLLAALVKTESGGNGRAVSSKGALGLTQVMPATARALGVTDPARLLTDSRLALEVGAAYLKQLQARLGNDVRLVLAGYNAGPGAVVRAGMQIPAYRETQAYVGRIMTDYAALRAAAR